jgi:ribosomal protein S27E
MEKAKPGWYFYVQCSNCNEDIIFREAPPPVEIPQAMSRGVTVICPHCNKEDTYPAARVRRGVVEDNNK